MQKQRLIISLQMPGTKNCVPFVPVRLPRVSFTLFLFCISWRRVCVPCPTQMLYWRGIVNGKMCAQLLEHGREKLWQNKINNDARVNVEKKKD